MNAKGLLPTEFSGRNRVGSNTSGFGYTSGSRPTPRGPHNTLVSFGRMIPFPDLQRLINGYKKVTKEAHELQQGIESYRVSDRRTDDTIYFRYLIIATFSLFSIEFSFLHLHNPHSIVQESGAVN